ncbi:MAG TPA: DUF5985 family protein [Candidatus Acidoferrales bacterium]|nr:DUF5985 family protein [Candidatus Acidoferrales bacterium]
MTYAVLSGVTFGLCLAAAALLLRSYRRSRDRLFLLFAIPFFILGVNQLVLGILNRPEADLPFAHLPRLISFLFIIAAIVDKNRAVRRRTKLRLVHDKEPERPRRARL